MIPAPAAIDPPVRRRVRRAPARDVLTMRRLEVLMSLYRRGLDGAGAELVDALDCRRDELARCLGAPSLELPLPGGAEQVPRIVALIDQRLAEMRVAQAENRLVEAERLAARLADESVPGLDGFELDMPLLGALVAVTGFDVVGFRIRGEVVGIGRVFVAAMLREVGTVALTSFRVVPAESSIHIGYTGAHCNGRFRLRLLTPDVRRVCVVVDLDALHREPLADESVYSPANTPSDAAPCSARVGVP